MNSVAIDFEYCRTPEYLATETYFSPSITKLSFVIQGDRELQTEGYEKARKLISVEIFNNMLGEWKKFNTDFWRA
jgi:hypothetical protein